MIIKRSDLALAAGDALFTEAVLQTFLCLGRSILVGLCGSQGSGKSTTARRLVDRLGKVGVSAIACSLDDFYLTRKERLALGETVHSLLATRGVPGTHDLGLASSVINALLDPAEGEVRLPVFNKLADDRETYASWTIVEPCEVLILEGWCVGARAQNLDDLMTPVNALEQDQDPDGTWRNYVNERLAGDYRKLFERLDMRLMLRAPSFECTHGWRLEQELSLERQLGGPAPMDGNGIAQFIAHYERITRWLLEDEPADLIADLDSARRPIRWRLNKLS